MLLLCWFRKPSATIFNKKNELEMNAAGKAEIIYLFLSVTSEGSIRMDENEELWVIEHDQGDGWTRVRRLNASNLDPMPEGFVPSSYIDVYEKFSVPV